MACMGSRTKLMPWTREQMAERAVSEMRGGGYFNIGIGLPTLINNCVLPEGVMLQNENGMLGMGPFPYEGDEDPDIIAPASRPSPRSTARRILMKRTASP